jgi:hypothetical protein
MTTIVEEARVISLMYCMLVLFMCYPCSHVLKEAQKVTSRGLVWFVLSGVVSSLIRSIFFINLGPYHPLSYTVPTYSSFFMPFSLSQLIGGINT